MGLMQGCNIGTKTTKELLFISPVPIPEVVKGAPVVATNEKISISILGQSNFFSKQKVTGYVLCDPWYYATLIKGYEELLKVKKMNGYQELIAIHKLRTTGR